MIVVDTSAIVAIILAEPGGEALEEKLFNGSECFISPVSIVEATMVLSREGSDAAEIVRDFLIRTNIRLAAVDAEQTKLAQEAFLRYGKGRHPARLNIADCFSYAAAKALGAKLLFTGNDFAKTDVTSA